MSTGVFIGLADNPGWSVADAEVEHFALLDQGIEALHDFGNAGCIVPPVDVQDVDVADLQLAQARIHADAQRLQPVSAGVDVDLVVEAAVGSIVGGVLGSDHHCVASLRVGGQPFADPSLGLLRLVVVGGIDEVPTFGVEVIQYFEGPFLGHFAHE